MPRLERQRRVTEIDISGEACGLAPSSSQRKSRFAPARMAGERATIVVVQFEPVVPEPGILVWSSMKA